MSSITKISSPSKVAIEADGRSPVTVQLAKGPGICAMCGYPHGAGDAIVPFAPDDSFTDFAALKGPSSPVICGWCAATWNIDYTQRALKSVMCKDGVFSAASNADISYWLHNPPSGNWLWVMGDQQRQHIVWRATVNTSAEVFQIRQGETNMTIRRKRLFEACDAAKRLAAAASEGRKGAALKSPFARLSRDLNEPGHGGIRYDLHAKALTNPDVSADVRLIQSCTPGELWALTAVLYASPNPERPRRLFVVEETSSETETETQ